MYFVYKQCCGIRISPAESVLKVCGSQKIQSISFYIKKLIVCMNIILIALYNSIVIMIKNEKTMVFYTRY